MLSQLGEKILHLEKPYLKQQIWVNEQTSLLSIFMFNPTRYMSF